MTDYTRKVHKCAVVVFCEAEGVDEADAAYAAQLAISHTLRENAVKGVKLESINDHQCAECGVTELKLTKKGLIPSHAAGERWVAREKKYRCPGSGKKPRNYEEPVVGYIARNGHTLYARVHQLMEVGVALGNGYLWARTTRKAF